MQYLRYLSVSALVLGLSLGLLPHSARAQGASDSKDGSASGDAAGGGANSGDQEVSGSDLAGRDLSTKQKADFADRAADEINSGLTKVLRLIEDAQRKKDIVLLNCLNDKLGALRGLLKVAEDSKLNLAEAVVRENQDLQEHNFRKLNIASQQAKTVFSEAEACIGQVGFVTTGQTRVVLTVEGGDTSGDTDFGAVAGGSTRPPDASAYYD